MFKDRDSAASHQIVKRSTGMFHLTLFLRNVNVGYYWWWMKTVTSSLMQCIQDQPPSKYAHGSQAI